MFEMADLTQLQPWQTTALLKRYQVFSQTFMNQLGTESP